MPSPKSAYTPESAAVICDRLACGETLSEICRDPTMPGRKTVYDWLDAQPAFAEAYKLARDKGFDAIAEDALRIANTPVSFVVTEDSERFGQKTKRGDAVDHRKLQVWTRLQLLAKWSPRYRESSNVALTGADGGPLKVDDQTTAKRMAELMALAEARKSSQSDANLEEPDDYSDLV